MNTALEKLRKKAEEIKAKSKDARTLEEKLAMQRDYRRVKDDTARMTEVYRGLKYLLEEYA